MIHYQFHWINAEELRPCGECQACCTTMAVAELAKENFTRCKHQCSGGCSIYEQPPESCQTFECWYRGGLVKHRPDRIGVIVNYNPVINTIYVWEVRPGARKNKKVKRLISSLTKNYSAGFRPLPTSTIERGCLLDRPPVSTTPHIDSGQQQVNGYKSP